jgi:hypothetical protein
VISIENTEKMTTPAKDKLIKFASSLSELQGVFETTENDMYFDKVEVSEVMEESIARTCLNILVSLVNQDMQITSKNAKLEKAIVKFNRKAQIKRKMDSIVFNQLGYGTGLIFYDVTIPKIKIYDNETIEIIHNPLADEFEGLWQEAQYLDPEELKKGFRHLKWVREYIKPDNLLVIPGIGRGYGESLLRPAIPYVAAKRELVSSLYDLVRRLGLLTVIGVELPGDISDDSVDEYLKQIEDMIHKAAANTTWILPKETVVEGVRGSGEARIIESVKTIIELLDEEIRKCVFVPDTFLTSLSANRATAKEQRYMIASMIQHVRDLIEEALRTLYDQVLIYEGFNPDIDEYDFSWGNINMPEPEALFTFLTSAIDQKIVEPDEVRAFLNLGSMSPALAKLQKAMNKQILNPPKPVVAPTGEAKPSQVLSDNKGGGQNGQASTRTIQPRQNPIR